MESLVRRIIESQKEGMLGDITLGHLSHILKSVTQQGYE